MAAVEKYNIKYCKKYEGIDREISNKDDQINGIRLGINIVNWGLEISPKIASIFSRYDTRKLDG